MIKADPNFMETLRFKLKNEYKMNYRYVLVIKELLLDRIANKIDHNQFLTKYGKNIQE